MALVAWHRLRTCDELDLAVAFDFTSQYSSPTAAEPRVRGCRPRAGRIL